MDFYLGQIVLFPYMRSDLNGFVLCDGSLVPISQNNALFALIGTLYGGDGQNTFAVPDLRKASPASGLQYYINVNGSFPSFN